jgi:hypothetical protein
MFMTISRYVLDRFEGEFAVLEAYDGGMRNIEKDRLPENIKEGDVLAEENGIFTMDAAATRERAEKINALMRGLFD